MGEPTTNWVCGTCGLVGEEGSSSCPGCGGQVVDWAGPQGPARTELTLAPPDTEGSAVRIILGVGIGFAVLMGFIICVGVAC